jgi:Flp pilus assembly protein TadD
VRRGLRLLEAALKRTQGEPEPGLLLDLALGYAKLERRSDARRMILRAKRLAPRNKEVEDRLRQLER